MSTESIVSRDTILEIPVESIRPNPYQPRRTPGDLANMAASIREHGIQQPITARDNGDGTYTLIAGERRWRAAHAAGLATVPLIVRADGDPAILALVENIQRADLNPLEEARAFQRLLDRGETQQSLAKRLGIGRTVIAQKVRLLGLDTEAAHLLDCGEISEAAARQILRLDLFDAVATKPPLRSWQNHYAHYVLWGPNYARTTEDVTHMVDGYISDFYWCIDAYERRSVADAEVHAESILDARVRSVKPSTMYSRAALMYLHLRPDWSKLTRAQRNAISDANVRWFTEQCRRYPPKWD